MLRAKLAWPQALLATVLAVVGAFALWSLRTLGTSSERILQDNYRSVLASQRIEEALERLDRAVLARLAGRPAAEPEETRRSTGRLEEELRVQEGNVTEPGEAAATARLRAAWDRYREAHAGLAALPDREALARAYFERLEPAYGEVRAAAEEILAINQDAMVRKSEVARRLAARLVVMTVLATLGGLLLGLALSTGLTARITRPLSVLSQTVRRIAEGDLAARARVRGHDELALLASEFNAMADRLAQYRASSLGELLQAQQAAQAAIDSLPDPVLVIDPAGTLVNVNRAAAEVLGLGEGGPGLAGLDPAMRATVERVRAHVLSGKGPYQPRGFEEAVRLDREGGPRFLLPRATPLYGEGGVAAVTVVLQEVTRLMRFDELKNDLVATVAHEFRTPLTSLRMAIHLCLEEAAGPLAERQADLLSAARDDCERLQGIVEDLLDLSRIQSGRVELHRRRVPVRPLLEEAAAAIRAAAEAAGVTLELAPGEALDEALQADPERLQLVLGNLLSNAVRHTPAGGRVTVSAARDERGIRLEVQDTGEGIPREYQERIFERFFRVPGARSGGAVGLGLYLAREIVRAHGGEIGVESAPGAGSRFWVVIPGAPAEAGAPAAAPG
ncbi:MAG TPA: ATP-binding protein [Anaeromyxobacter sp.]|nr:ATP-binding protein [Anaeromyxobacter sp.]